MSFWDKYPELNEKGKSFWDKYPELNEKGKSPVFFFMDILYSFELITDYEWVRWTMEGINPGDHKDD